MYTPNFNDPRVVKRVTKAVGFAVGVMSETKAKQWSTRYIDKHFGQQQHPMSQWLRSQLLIVADNHWSKDTKKCKKYLLNREGADNVIRILKEPEGASVEIFNKPHTLDLDNASDRLYDQWLVSKNIELVYGDQLRDGTLEYEEHSHRLFNNLQNYRSVYRKQILADDYDYRYNYDIEACAPTIIEQLSRRYGNDLYMPTYAYYLDNKHEFRNTIQDDFEIDAKPAKVLINSLFNGARIGHNADYSTSHLLGETAKIELAKQHPLICGLREDIKLAWSYIIDSNQEISRRRKIDSGRLQQVSSKEKWLVYFKYESLIISQIHKYLDKNNNKHLLEHDGWCCVSEVDTEELLKQIQDSTGFSINLSLDYVK